MDAFSPTRQFNNQKIELLLLDIDDFNGLISILKRREENIIQVLDYNLKYKNSTKEEEINQLELLKTQLKDIEKTRITKEDQIVSKYANLKVTDPRQKKLVIKLVNKLIQLNVSVKDKLTELDIYDKTKESYQMIPEFEENLKKLISRQIFQVDLILSYIIEKSRLRLEQNINIDINQRKINIQKLEKILISDHIIYSNPNSLVTMEDLKDEKELKPAITNKFKNQSLSPIRQRPYLQKSSSKELSEEPKKETLTILENNSIALNTAVESQSIVIPPTRNNIQPNQTLKSPDLKKSSIPQTVIEKPSNEGVKNNLPKKEEGLPDFVKSQSTTQSSLKLTLNKSTKALPSAQAAQTIGEETPSSTQNDSKFEFKTVRVDPYKYYDILKIENKAPPIMTQKNKKNFLEKLYNELCAWNTDVKRTIFKYRLEYMIFSDKTKKKATNQTATDISTQIEMRSQSSTPVANISQAPRAISTRQNNHLYSQNLRGRVEQIRCQSSFESSTSPFGTNSLQPNTTKSRAGQRVLVLPKLNIFEESYYVRPATQSVGTPPSKEGISKSKQSSILVDPKSKNERQEGTDDMILVQADEAEFISNPSLSIPIVNFTPISRNYSPSFKENPNGPKNIRAFGNILSKINAETFINNQLSKIQGFNLTTEKQRLSELNDKYINMRGEMVGGVLPKTVYHNIRLSTSKTQK